MGNERRMKINWHHMLLTNSVLINIGNTMLILETGTHLVFSQTKHHFKFLSEISGRNLHYKLYIIYKDIIYF
jgi:hypothetical protein